MAVSVSARIGAPADVIASTRILQFRPDVVIVGRADSRVVVVFRVAVVKVRVSEPTVTVPATSVWPVTLERVTATRKGTDGRLPVRLRVAAVVSSYSLCLPLTTR